MQSRHALEDYLGEFFFFKNLIENQSTISWVKNQSEIEKINHNKNMISSEKYGQHISISESIKKVNEGKKSLKKCQFLKKNYELWTITGKKWVKKYGNRILLELTDKNIKKKLKISINSIM